jgi:hypothetical protein
MKATQERKKNKASQSNKIKKSKRETINEQTSRNNKK